MKIAFRIVRCVLASALICAFIVALASDVLYTAPQKPTDRPTMDVPSTDTPDGPSDDAPDVPATPILPDDTVPNWSIDPVIIRNTVADKNGKILCETRYSYPSVSSNDGSDVSAFARELDIIASRIRLFVDTRSELYKAGTSDDFSVPPQITGYYEVNRFSSEIFSITFVFSETAPDSTVSETRINYNLDLLLSSKKISIDSIMNDAVSSVKKKLIEMKESGRLSLPANYENMLAGLIDESWSATTLGISFRFDRGSLVPASYGEVEVFISNAELIPLLSDYGKILLNLSEKAG